MKYQYQDKFKVEGIDLDIEILGRFPSGQQRTLQIKDDSYRVLMNGAEVDITETNLELLRKASKVEVKSEAPEMPLTQDTEKKKIGRPSKK